jgi:hypothetical protein
MMDTHFPNAVVHAVAMLDACHDNVEDARYLAHLNAMNAGDLNAEFDHWTNVGIALMPAKAAQA